MQTRWTSFSGVVLLLAAAVASAHHSPAMFDPQQTKTLTGTVRQFQWTNPHCYIQLLVKNDKGQEEEWSLEMGAPTYLYARGWRPSTLKPGDRLNVTIAPLRKGGTGGMLLQATTPDGKPVGSKPLGSKPQGGQPQGSQPQGSQPQGSQPQGSQPQGSKP